MSNDTDDLLFNMTMGIFGFIIIMMLAGLLVAAILSSGGPDFYTKCQDRGGIVTEYHHPKFTDLYCIVGNQVVAKQD